MSTNEPYDSPPIQPQIPRPSGSNTGLVIGIVAAVVAIPIMLACAGIVVALLLPAVQAAREAARRQVCTNNLKQISLALLNYESAYGSFPPAYTVDANGEPLHSWRTLILPYMEQQALYSQIDLTRPWDDPANVALSQIDIPAFRCPSAPIAPGTTTYVAVIDTAGIFSGPQPTKLGQIRDGMSNTLLVIETEAANAVAWMSPQDIDVSMLGGPARTSHPGGRNCAMADGSVRFLSTSVNPQTVQGLITKDGGELLTLP